MNQIKRDELSSFLNTLLTPQLFKDYCPNGLQVEGVSKIKKIAFAVSATEDSINQTVEMGADSLITHHGLFWNFHGPKTITGAFAKRMKPLIQNNINLFGYHLPLDANLQCGNAKCIADLIGLKNLEAFGDYKGCPTGAKGSFTTPICASELKEKLGTILKHDILHSNANSKPINSLGIITGGANSGWLDAKEHGLDAYVTGEMSEHDWHESKENDIHMFAGGHHATEQFGIQALQKLIEENFKIGCIYIDSENPA